MTSAWRHALAYLTAIGLFTLLMSTTYARTFIGNPGCHLASWRELTSWDWVSNLGAQYPVRFLDSALIFAPLFGALTVAADFLRARSAWIFVLVPALVVFAFVFWASPLRQALLTDPIGALRGFPALASCYFVVIAGNSAAAALSGYAYWRMTIRSSLQREKRA